MHSQLLKIQRRKKHQQCIFRMSVSFMLARKQQDESNFGIKEKKHIKPKVKLENKNWKHKYRLGINISRDID